MIQQYRHGKANTLHGDFNEWYKKTVESNSWKSIKIPAEMFVTATTAVYSVIESVPLKHPIVYFLGAGNVDFMF